MPQLSNYKTYISAAVAESAAAEVSVGPLGPDSYLGMIEKKRAVTD